MSVLAYSELLKRITGIKEEDLDAPFKILSRHNTTQARLEAIKGLARHEPTTIGNLLHEIGSNRGGGSYLTIQKYFNELEGEGLLIRTITPGKTTWLFSEKGNILKRFLNS